MITNVGYSFDNTSRHATNDGSNSARSWVRGLCLAMKWNPERKGIHCMNTNEFLNKVFSKLAQYDKPQLKKFVDDLCHHIPVLKGKGILQELKTFAAVLIKKLCVEKTVAFTNVCVPGPECTVPDRITVGNITVVRDTAPKTLTPCEIYGLVYMFNTYYRAHTFDLETILKNGEHGEQYKSSEIANEVELLNCRLRWWDFQAKHEDPNIPTARNNIRAYLTFLLGFANPISDACIFRLFVTPVGEVTSVTAIINAKAYTNALIKSILRDTLLYDVSADPQNTLTMNNKNPLTNVTMNSEMEVYRRELKHTLEMATRT